MCYEKRTSSFAIDTARERLKHIEGVLAALRRRGVRGFRQAAAAGSPRIELFLRRGGDPTPTLIWPRQLLMRD